MRDNMTFIPTFKKNIKVSDLLIECIKKWYILVFTTLITFIIVAVYTFVIQTPMYSSTAKIMIFNKQETTVLADLELSSSIYLARDFTEIISDKFILEDVSLALNKKYSASQIKNFITINNPQNTRIIEITVLSPDPEDSKKIVDSICDISQSKLVELMGLDRITPISYGVVPKNQTTPNVYYNLTAALFLGLILSFGIVTLMFALDNKVSTVQDVEKYVGLSVLATIPYNSAKKS